MERKNFYKMVLALVIPIALQNLINVAVQSMDVIMLGKLENSQIAISAASLGGQVCFIMSLIFFGMASGLSVLTSQYWGKNDKNAIEIIIGLTMRLAIIVGIVFTIATLLFTEPIMNIFTSDKEVARQGVYYLRIVCFSYVMIAFTTTYLNAMRSMEKVVVATVIYTISLFINVFFNWVFIFGNLGVKPMGVEGAAIGTVIARFSELIMVFIYNKKINNVLKIRLKTFTLKSKILKKDYIKFSMPVIINEMMWGLGISMTTAILGNLGSDVSSANAIAQVARQLAIVLVMGIASATAITLGKVIGQNKMKEAEIYGSRFTKLAIVSGIIGSIVVLIVRPIILKYMNFTGEAYNYAGFMLYAVAYYVILQSINTVWIVGIFRAGGDTKFGMIVDIICLWGIGVGVASFCAFVLKANVYIVYLVILTDELGKIPFTFKRYRSKIWLRNVTR